MTATVIQFPAQRISADTTPPAPDPSTLAFVTVPAMDLRPRDVIGGSCGAWLEVKAVFTDPNVRHLVTEVEVAPLDAPARARTWPLDAAALIAILRPSGGAR
jgi:hypothetical protein